MFPVLAEIREYAKSHDVKFVGKLHRMREQEIIGEYQQWNYSKGKYETKTQYHGYHVYADESTPYPKEIITHRDGRIEITWTDADGFDYCV